MEEGESIYPSDGLCVNRDNSLSWRLWQDAQALAHKSLEHPFVTGLGDGSLPSQTFQQYLAQDVVYLTYYSKAYEFILRKCNDTVHGSEVRVAISGFMSSVDREIRLHEQKAMALGADLSHGVPAAMSSATQAYTDFLMEVAQGEQYGVEAVLAAMAPCSRLYGFLGCHLAAKYGTVGPYCEWIKTYSSSTYLAIPALMEKLLDGMEGLADYGVLKELYMKAMQLEYEFFDQQ